MIELNHKQKISVIKPTHKGRNKIESVKIYDKYSVNYIIYSKSEILYDFKICRLKCDFDKNEMFYYYCVDTIFEQETLTTDTYIEYQTVFVGSFFQEAIIFKDKDGNIYSYGLNDDTSGERNIYTFWIDVIFDD